MNVYNQKTDPNYTSKTYTAICRTEGCDNANTPLVVECALSWTDWDAEGVEYKATSAAEVYCGVCMSQIDDLKVKK